MRRRRWISSAWQWWRANYPDVARLVGLALFVYAAVIDRGRNPALIPGATGLVFLKNVVGNGGGK